MRVATVFLLVAVVAGAAVGSASGQPQDPPRPSPCDVARIADGEWCANCRKVLRKGEKETDYDKNGKCKACSGAPEKVKVCVKDWVPVCGMHDQRSHERTCCGSKMCCKHETVAARVVHKCKKCGAVTPDPAKRGCTSACDGELEATCERSGQVPHGAFCDVKTVETGPYCSDRQCRKLLEKGDLDKEGRCIACRKKPDTAKICVKEGGGKTYRARVVISCRACKAEGAEGGTCATKDCSRAGKALEPVCTDSGCWPHGGASRGK